MSLDHFSAKIESTLDNATIPIDRQSEALVHRMTLPSIPYPGLRAFEIPEAPMYFGREEATSELLQKLASSRFIAVVGPSGSGKSSLVKAGLIPALGADFVPSDGLPWAVAVLRPGAAPIRALAVALWELMQAEGDGAEEMQAGRNSVEATLRGTSAGLLSLSRRCQGIKGKNLLIVVDQLEDLFRFGMMTNGVERPVPFGLQPVTQPPASHSSGMLGFSGTIMGEGEEAAGEQSLVDEACLFVKLLLYAASQAEVPISVIVTLRTEYLGSCVMFEGLHEAASEGQYSIPPMTQEQITQAIFCPAAASNVFFTARLMDRLLVDMDDKPYRLSVLQEALLRTWTHGKTNLGSERWLDLHHYESAGGMACALSRHADEVYLGLPNDADRQIAERLFKRLTAAWTSGQDARCPTRFGELCAIAAVGAEEMANVIEAFRTESRPFLMPIPDGPLTADSYVDITHESLIFAWQRLRQWAEEEAESAALYRRLAETAVFHKRGKAGLWQNPDLKLAETWYRDQAPSPAWAQQYHPNFHAAIAFLEMSKLSARRRKMMFASVLAFVPIALLALLWGMRNPLSSLDGIDGVADVNDAEQPVSVALDTGGSAAGQVVATPGEGAEISQQFPKSLPESLLNAASPGTSTNSLDADAGTQRSVQETKLAPDDEERAPETHQMGSAQDSTLEAADAVETVDMAAVSSSLSPPADQEKVTQLLGLAKQSLKAYRLTSPRDNSALHYYKQVLQLDPDNEDAKGGVREIATRYAWLADQAMLKSQYTKARRFARLGLSINPSDRHLLTLQIRASQQISKSTTDNKKITDTPNIPESTSERVWRSIQEAFSKDPSANTQSQRSFQNK